jgi:hypothetical protein
MEEIADDDTLNQPSIPRQKSNEHEQNLLPPAIILTNPQETLKLAVEKLNHENWKSNMCGACDVVQVSRQRPQLIQPYIGPIYRAMIGMIKSLRTVVVRTGCQVMKELFDTVRNTQRPEYDELVAVLLHKTSDSNKLIRKDANEALDSMILHIQPVYTVRVLYDKGLCNKNVQVRQTTARLLVCLVGVAGVDNIYIGNKVSGRVLSTPSLDHHVCVIDSEPN